uniref:Uncharacterized protein n=1 Tax=Rhizophora mucronata TaxID=61149 RepID=A0A2P2QVV4_RHIMU
MRMTKMHIWFLTSFCFYPKFPISTQKSRL